MTTKTITHMLGYLEPKKWADAYANGEVDYTEFWELLREQDRVYNSAVTEEVKEILKERKSIQE